jgi:allantoate deiminase
MLEARGLPVGVVSSISGQTRIEAEFRGEAGHAGTLPMNARRDALCGAAEMVLAAESLARGAAGLVATAGRIAAEPGASNVVPGAARLSLDVRHPDDGHRRAALRLLRERAEAIAARRELGLDWRVLLDCDAVACTPELSASLARAIEDLGYEAYRLASGAGHDAVALAELTRVAMLFVRCKRGISHNPAEEVSVGDVAVAIQTLDRFLELAAGQD